jgi:hypothetical protein
LIGENYSDDFSSSFLLHDVVFSGGLTEEEGPLIAKITLESAFSLKNG